MERKKWLHFVAAFETFAVALYALSGFLYCTEVYFVSVKLHGGDRSYPKWYCFSGYKAQGYIVWPGKWHIAMMPLCFYTQTG